MIRTANEEDAARIVRIHLNSWRSTYSNIFPKEVFDKQERLAQLNQELNRLKIERKYFNEYLNETNVTVDYTKYKRSMKSNKWMKLWQECQSISEVNKDINFFLKLKFFILQKDYLKASACFVQVKFCL